MACKILLVLKTELVFHLNCLMRKDMKICQNMKGKIKRTAFSARGQEGWIQSD